MSFRVTLDTSFSANIDSQEVYCFENPDLRYTVHGDVGTIYHDGFTGQVGFYATPLGSDTTFAQWEYSVGTSGIWQISTDNPFYYNDEEDITIYAVGVSTNGTARVTLRDGSYNNGVSDVEFFGVTIRNANGIVNTVPDLAFDGGTKALSYADLTLGETLTIAAVPLEGKSILGWQYSYQSPSGLRFTSLISVGSLTIKLIANTEITACTNGFVQISNGDSWKMAAPYVYSGGKWQRATPYVYHGGVWQPCY